MSLMLRIERSVLEGRQRNKNRLREHSGHEWEEIRRCGNIVLMDCPCGWIGWIPSESLTGTQGFFPTLRNKLLEGETTSE